MDTSEFSFAVDRFGESVTSLVRVLDSGWGPDWMNKIDDLTAELKRFNDLKEKELTLSPPTQ